VEIMETKTANIPLSASLVLAENVQNGDNGNDY